MSLHLKIQEPSGESRTTAIYGKMILGRGEDSNIVLRDSSLAREAAILWASEPSPSSDFWIKIPNHLPPGVLGGISVREAQMPVGIPLQIGDTHLMIEKSLNSNDYPSFPSGVRPWFTCTDAGKELLWTAKKSASTSLSIYLGGETGTGKEVLAHLIHAWSARKSAPFIPIHCGAIPVSLAESELFGHVKGAYTGAIQQRTGALLQAHGGTLFLDEIGDLPLDIQVKLLRFLENGEIRPIGSDRSFHADVRLICATHHPLHQLVEEGKFRRDLFFRLASVTLSIPTLRSRPKDIDLLARKFASEMDKTLSPKALLRLKAHVWPGNVRELRHAVERAVGMSGTFTKILADDAFDFLLTPSHVSKTPELELGAPVLSLHEMEKVVLLKALRICEGNRVRTAKTLGIARSTLFEMLKRHRIQGPKKVV